MSKFSVIILGAGKPYRGEDPSSLIRTDGTHKVLDWLMEAFNGIQETEFHFIGGYCLDEVVKNYPNLYFSVNPNWRSSGSLGSLMVAPLSPDHTTYVCYADIVFRRNAVNRLHEEDDEVVFAVDSTWRNRYQSRSQEDLKAAEKVCIKEDELHEIGTDIDVETATAEFVGLMKFSPQAVKKIISLREGGLDGLAKNNIPYLIKLLHESGLKTRPVELQGDWAELNAPQDLARFALGTKAETLERLRPLVKHSVINDQVSFTVGEWNVAKDKFLTLIRKKFGDEALVVRSSALSEDSWSTSQAGVYTSLLNIPGGEAARVADAVDEVIRSYNDNDPSHQVLIQSMLTNIKISGVVLTRTLNHGAPYYTVNYDDLTSDSQAVTSGTGKNLKTMIIHRGSFDFEKEMDSPVSYVIRSIKELENLVGHDSLDAEFAVTDDGVVHVLQLRPITINQENCHVSDSHIEQVLLSARKLFCQRQEPGPFILGRRTFFGVMPDWNPAEIIGTKPRQLAVTLYQHLFTDEIWADQRVQYGYRDVRPHPLLVSFGGHPYIDVRASFNSFIPAILPDKFAERLVEHYLNRLEQNPYLHDKIEFDVVFSCFTFDFEKQAERLLYDGFARQEIVALSEALIGITKKAMRRLTGDLEQIDILQKRFEMLQDNNLDPLDRAYLLLEDCKRYGALPFAHLARAGFVAISLLNSLEAIGVTNSGHTASFLNSLNTVAGMLQRDGYEVVKGKMSWEKFVSLYGHLRPGTYEITSSTYAEDPDCFLKPIVKKSQNMPDCDQKKSVWNDETRLEISKKLKDSGLSDNVQEFETFLRRAIEGREYAKFIFSKNLSAALNSFIQFGSGYGMSREQLSHLPLRELLSFRTGRPMVNVGEHLVSRAEEGKKNCQLSESIEFPPLLLNENDLFAFERSRSQPNFITRKKIIAKVINLSNNSGSLSSTQEQGLNGKIVLISQADPGFDWLFGHEIGGLVTMYGGANSHMSIRAAEFGVPAAIGVGESLYEQLSCADIIEMNCASHIIRVIQ